MTITANSYFSGAGLMDEGLRRAGVQVQISYELDADACRVATANGHNIEQCDLTKKLIAEMPDSDVDVFTYPCTKYSTIGDIHGVRTGDELYLHALRRMALRPPEVYVIENVPGMKKFPVVMEAMTKLPDYYVNVFCPVKSQTWLPQKRDRVIIIGSRRSFQWREPQAAHQTRLADILEPEPQIEIPAYFYKRLEGKYRDKPIISDPARDDIAPTCVAHYAKDVSTRVVVDSRFPHGVRPYTVREYARLQGLPDTFTFAGVTERDAYRMIGNGVSVPVGEWIGNELQRYFN